MSKNIRQKIASVIQTTFRSSPQKKLTTKTKLTTCCSIQKPIDYDYVAYVSTSKSKQENNYIDLSECHSWSNSNSTDSGVSFDSNLSSISSVSEESLHPLQSTKIDSEDSCSMLTLSQYSYIPHDQQNISQFDVSAWNPVPTSFQCCHCQCHHPSSATTNMERSCPLPAHLYYTSSSRELRSKNQVYPFIF